MRSALFAGVVILSLSLVATGQANNSKGSSSTPDKETTNLTAQERPAEPSNFTSAKGFVLEDATPVRLRLNRTLSSADSHVGDTVDFEVLQDISASGTLVIPRGALAFGTVTEAQPTRKLARGGRLEIKVDYVRLLDSERAALRAVQGGKGGSRVVGMTAGIVATGLFFFPAAPLFLFMHGKDITIPKGAELTGYIDGLHQWGRETGHCEISGFQAEPSATIGRDHQYGSGRQLQLCESADGVQSAGC
jgi:hypothetical protein